MIALLVFLIVSTLTSVAAFVAAARSMDRIFVGKPHPCCECHKRNRGGYLYPNGDRVCLKCYDEMF